MICYGCYNFSTYGNTLVLFRYDSSYPDQRVKKDANDLDMGVIGSVSMLQNATLSTQPITSFDWSPDKVNDIFGFICG